MVISYKITIVLCLISALLAAAVTRQFFAKTKTVEVQHDVIHNDIQTIIKTIKLPSGEVDSTTTIVDHTNRIDSDSKSSTTAIPPNWLVSASASITGIDFAKPAYGIQVNRRILGPLFLGAQFTTRGEAGISIGMEF